MSPTLRRIWSRKIKTDCASLSEVHDTTSINGIHQKDPLGPHVTLCYKDENQLLHGTHVASHGYVRGKDDIGFVSERQQGKKTVWPSEKELEAVPEIGYGHRGYSSAWVEKNSAWVEN
ncbi:hypothetical protein P175DRAFT_0558910 [Aspergillus ochraceoroseus IBT 24754]|uniref:Uncharacterized protein n=1 Tax=Aspergillus ochraceoroseus IBT 24754 TaxID=1392256 RepID=A0A2T5LSU6_9EURO|nr:uncharacterized protein P175DRAFT_0558910 [Aspergillus ochraceoroseus IBT 24754]PTU19346.1 hypothetical protein P175DRAFT_0558910 [Aspergillus ochraceoroseus IBT 24754]